MRLYLCLAPLMVFICAISSAAHAQPPSQTNCPDLEVKAEITHTREGNGNGEIVLKFSGESRVKQYHIFLQCAGCVELKKADGRNFTDLKPGYYDIYIIDNKGCSKQLNLQVK